MRQAREGRGERIAGVGNNVCKDSAVPVKLRPGTAVEEYTCTRQRIYKEESVGLYRTVCDGRRDWNLKDPWVSSEDINHTRNLNREDST